MDIELKKYNDVLKNDLKNNSENHLLLGNGFNLSMGVNTSYENIFNKMKENYKGYSNLIIKNKNYDIEDIIGELKQRIKENDKSFLEEKDYKSFLDNFINNKVKMDFMNSALTIAKDSLKDIYQEKNEGIGILFEHFTNYFSLNYDPLLYLLLMKYKKLDTNKILAFSNTTLFKVSDINIRDTQRYKEIKNIYLTYTKNIQNIKGEKIVAKKFCDLKKIDFERQLREVLKKEKRKYDKDCVTFLYEELNENERKSNVNDGFIGKSFKKDSGINSPPQNVFFLHGVFHIYKDKERIYKITQTQNKALYEKLEEILDSEDKEIVCVFTNDNKIDEIKANTYLKKGIEKLETLTGSIVIIGSSLDKNDKHIFDSINKSNIKKVYYASFEKSKKKDKERLKELFPEKKIFLFDRETISYEKENQAK